jgi:NlpC/P60 family putative phage cell wall peptidase
LPCAKTQSVSRAAIVAEARAWLGTPYRHQASVRGAGCDCLGLVRGVWRACIGLEPEAPPPYSPDWDERGDEALLEAARRWLNSTNDEQPGDVLLFRMVAGAPVKHAAILVAPERMIHAYWGRAVVESRLGGFWRTRLAATFSFPGV